MKRTPLKRRSPLRRSRPNPRREPAELEPVELPIPKAPSFARKPRAPKRRSAYARRARDWDRMGWCKLQPCAVAVDPPPGAVVTPCSGVIEADHQGEHAKGRKAPDDTVVPMCNGHHRERTDHYGTFRDVPLEVERAWRDVQIERTRRAWDAHRSGERPY